MAKARTTRAMIEARFSLLRKVMERHGMDPTGLMLVHNAQGYRIESDHGARPLSEYNMGAHETWNTLTNMLAMVERFVPSDPPGVCSYAGCTLAAGHVAHATTTGHNDTEEG